MIRKQHNDTFTLKKAITDIAKLQDIETEVRQITHELSNSKYFELNSYSNLLNQFIEEINSHSEATFILEMDPRIN